jgi:hypothetical protein
LREWRTPQTLPHGILDEDNGAIFGARHGIVEPTPGHNGIARNREWPEYDNYRELPIFGLMDRHGAASSLLVPHRRANVLGPAGYLSADFLRRERCSPKNMALMLHPSNKVGDNRDALDRDKPPGLDRRGVALA